MTGKRWAVPRGGTPTTHILRPEGPRFAGLAANEHFCLELARAANIPAVRTEVQDFDGIPTIIVERFDRYRDKRDRLIKRIHQEDCCQALGVHPNTKYQSDGEPGLPEIMELLLELEGQEDELRARLARQRPATWSRSTRRRLAATAPRSRASGRR